MRGIGVSGASTVVARGTYAGVYLWVVTLLTPSELGVVTIGLAVYTLLSLFKDFGLTPALISRKTAGPEVVAASYSIRLIIAGILAAIGFASSIALSELFEQPDLRMVLVFVALAIVAEPLGFLSNAMLQRELEFGKLAVTDIASSLALAAGSIAAGVLGFPILALFVGIAIASTSRTIVLLRIRPVSVETSKRNLRDWPLLSYGSKLVATSAVVYLFTNLNVWVLGRTDIYALGFYGLAFLWATTPADIAAAALSRVMLPTYASLIRRNKGVFLGYLETLKHLSIGVLLLFIPLFLSSPFLIHALYGPTWDKAVPILLVLLFFGLLRTLLEPIGSLVLSLERPGIILGTNLINLGIVAALVVPIAASYGALGCAYLLTVVYLSHILILWYIVLRQFDERSWTIFRVIAKPLISASVALGVGIALEVTTSAPYEELIAALAASLVYLGVMLTIAREDLNNAFVNVRKAFMIGRNDC